MASVTAQDDVSFEHVIVDDGSTDGSAETINAIAKSDPRVRLVNRPNGGCAKARNEGFKVATVDSEYLLFVDADDCLDPRMVHTLIDYLDAHLEVGMAYCDFSLMDSEDSPLSQGPLESGWKPRYAPSLGGLWAKRLKDDHAQTPFATLFAIPAIIPSVCMFRRSIYAQTPGWDEEMGIIYEDIGLYLHMALRSEVHFVPRKLVRYRRHAAQSSSAIEKFNRHEIKHYQNWKNPIGLTPAQLKTVHAAWRWRHGSLTLYRGLRDGGDRLRRGEFARAMQFFGGAARSYLLSFLPRQLA